MPGMEPPVKGGKGGPPQPPVKGMEKPGLA